MRKLYVTVCIFTNWHLTEECSDMGNLKNIYANLQENCEDVWKVPRKNISQLIDWYK